MINKEQRLVIYRATYERHLNDDQVPYSLCRHLQYVTDELTEYLLTLNGLKKEFPEFYENRPVKTRSCNRYWWSNTDHKSRVEYMDKLIKSMKS